MTIDAETTLQMTLEHFRNVLIELYSLKIVRSPPYITVELGFLEKAIRSYGDLRVSEALKK